MINLLIVDHNLNWITEVKEFYSDTSSLFNVGAALNSKEAIQIFEKDPIDLAVVNLKVPDMDGVDLIDHFKNHRSDIPVVVIAASDSQQQSKTQQLEPFSILTEPVDFNLLNQIINTELKQGAQKGFINDVSPASFLQIIEMEEKTCLIELDGGGEKKGHFYFDRGVLHNALYRDVTGDTAAMEMLSWGKVKISFIKLPREKTERRIYTDTMKLILASTEIRQNTTEPPQTLPSHTDQKTEDINAVEPAAREKQEPLKAPVGLEVLKRYGNFKGFLGIGLFTNLGRPVICHTVGDIDLSQAGNSLAMIASDAISSSGNLKSDFAQNIYFETDSVCVMSASTDGGPVSKSNDKITKFHIIMVASTGVPIGLVKIKFEKAKSSLYKELMENDPIVFQN